MCYSEVNKLLASFVIPPAFQKHSPCYRYGIYLLIDLYHTIFWRLFFEWHCLPASYCAMCGKSRFSFIIHSDRDNTSNERNEILNIVVFRTLGTKRRRSGDDITWSTIVIKRRKRNLSYAYRVNNWYCYFVPLLSTFCFLSCFFFFFWSHYGFFSFRLWSSLNFLASSNSCPI